mmetsp:Transcript_18263/g.50131  ORF Transcript_18263/g.50131 Transcript_18263/m.50131 type:complete len:252 (-) Transcript_18263:232-987(-)
MEGRVTAGPNDKGRWLVQLIFQGEMKELSLEDKNLIPKPSCGWEVVAAGLPMHMNEEDLYRAFSKYGVVQNVKVTRDMNGMSKGVALIVMAHRDAAEHALNLPEVDINGIPAKLQWSTMVKEEMGLMKNRDQEKGIEDAGSRRMFQETHREVPKSRALGPSAALSTPFSAGQAVLVSGLKSAPEFNGVIGHVQAVRSDGRCEVMLQVEGECKSLALKFENLSDAGAKVGAGTGEAADGSEGSAPARRRFKD